MAVEFASVIDGGQTLVTTAGRVAKEFEGKGVLSKLTKAIQDDYVMPSLKCEVISFSNENENLIHCIGQGNTFIMGRVCLIRVSIIGWIVYIEYL